MLGGRGVDVFFALAFSLAFFLGAPGALVGIFA
jgi:hypothetical protein